MRYGRAPAVRETENLAHSCVIAKKEQHVWSRQSRLIFSSAFTNTVNEPEPPGC